MMFRLTEIVEFFKWPFIAVLCIMFEGVYAQQTIQVYVEDFNSPNHTFAIEDSVFDNDRDQNRWVVNAEYSGQGIYPDNLDQNNTYSGTIGGAPQSNYLHIQDSTSSALNANFDRSAASDEFVAMLDGVCTFGMTDVQFSFFYSGQGNPDAYMEVYYSANSGSWTKTGALKYNGKSMWKFEVITDPAFNDLKDLRLGFRWYNTSTSGADSTSIGVDDVMIVGTYDEVNDPVDITITAIDSAVCQGKILSFSYELSDTLCDATYEIEVSDHNGNFGNSIGAWVTGLSYPNVSLTTAIQIPGSAVPSNCYKLRVKRLFPLPTIVGTESICFIIDSCANSIVTEQPSVTMDTNAVCIGSAIDVPFWSYGVFLSGNEYVAELSDTNGSFVNSTIINSNPDVKTYEPGMVMNPGQVGGIVPTVPEGCGYYVRVNSTNPAVSGAPWGPFCIRECDVEFNQKEDISVCVSDTHGVTVNVPVDINTYNTMVTYGVSNNFMVEILDAKTMAQVNLGGIGIKASTTSTSIDINIPSVPNLGSVGIMPKLWYIRLVATHPSLSDQKWSTIIRLTIGAPAIIPLELYTPDSLLCYSDISYVMVLFANSDSKYQWYLNGNAFPPNDPKNPLWVQFNSIGLLEFTAQETNFGCLGEMSPPIMIDVIPPPQTYITGDPLICEGDTVTYTVPFYQNTYYEWTLPHGAVIDTGNNEITVKIDTPGQQQLLIYALNMCGSASGSKNINVRDAPDVVLDNDTIICFGESIDLYGSGVGNGVAWYPPLAVNDPYSLNTSATPDTTTNFLLAVSDNFCTGRDSILVIVQELPTIDAGDNVQIEIGGYVQLQTNASAQVSWSPSTGLSCDDCPDPIASPTLTTTYYVTTTDSVGCQTIDTVEVQVLESVVNLPSAFTPNMDGENDIVFAEGMFVGDFNLKIYNRWGSLVFESTDMAYGWDGTFNGHEQPVGTYVYLVTGTLYGKPYVKQGNLSLIR